MRKVDGLVILAATLLLLAVDWLAFHDLREAHTVRDWLMLVASALVFLHFARILLSRRSSAA